MAIKRYEQCATRLENRGNAPPTREYVDDLVSKLIDANPGLEAIAFAKKNKENK